MNTLEFEVFHELIGLNESQYAESELDYLRKHSKDNIDDKITSRIYRCLKDEYENIFDEEIDPEEYFEIYFSANNTFRRDNEFLLIRSGSVSLQRRYSEDDDSLQENMSYLFDQVRKDELEMNSDTVIELF